MIFNLQEERNPGFFLDRQIGSDDYLVIQYVMFSLCVFECLVVDLRIYHGYCQGVGGRQ